MVEEPWDLLVVATGSEALRPPIDGIDLPGVYGLSVLQDGIELRKAIDAGPERAVIVGGGYIGLGGRPRPWSTGASPPPWSRPPPR